ncbi:MAG: MFS transporter [Thermoproteota archaeon]|nr:MFS transporter [Candidatus Brockarchaeota archaeon]
MKVNKRYTIRNLILIYTSRALRSFAAGFLVVAISLYLFNNLHLSTLLIGGIFTSSALATPILSLLLGRLGDIYGRKKVLLIDLMTLPISIVIILLTSNYVLLMVASALGGFGIAGGLVGGGVGASAAPLFTPLIAENTDEKNRTLAYSLNMLISTFSGAVGALMVSVFEFQELFLIGLFVTLASVFVIIPVSENYAPRKQKTNDPKEVQIQYNQKDIKYIKVFAAAGILNGFSQGIVAPFYPIIFNAFFGMSKSQIGYLISLGGILSGIAFIFTQYLTNKLGFLKLITLTRLISATFVLLLPFSPNDVFASVFYLLLTPLRAISLPAQTSLMMGLISEEHRSTASGTNQAARLIASACGTMIAGGLFDSFPFFVPFFIAAISTYGNIFIYIRFFRKIPEANRPLHETIDYNVN